MKLPEQFLSNSNGVLAIDPLFTELMGDAALATYADYEHRNDPAYTPPALDHATSPFGYIARFSGFDNVPWSTGAEERFGLIYQSSAHPDVYLVAFRGTSSTYDAWKDLESTSKATFSPHRRRSGFPRVVHVGKGFNDIYSTKNANMRATMQAQLFEKLRQLRIQPKYIYITGHSLGCALGSLFALDIAASLPGIKIISLNFASPRVGTGSWETCYDTQYALKTRTIRIRNQHDLVPKVPPEWPPFDFRHVGEPFDICYSPTSYLHVPVDIIDAWHSLLNYRYVVNRATKNSPEIWAGAFKNQAEPHFDMQSNAPNITDADWTSGELLKILERLKRAQKERT